MASTGRHLVQWIGLIAGPVLALLVYVLLPEQYTGVEGDTMSLTHGGRATLAVMAWMAMWWLTEAIDISATALLPIAVFPLLGILSIRDATAPYASDLIFLFMGGFILALSMQRWGLDKRIALFTLRIVGSKPASIIAGFMAVTAVLSMWVSNTATAAMMLPIALSVIDLVLKKKTGESLEESGLPEESGTGRNFALSLMLAIAYAASIGGIATIIGSPPNGILVQFVAQEYDREISFAQWMAIGGPVTLVFLPLAWALITWVLYPISIKKIEGGHELFEREFAKLGRMKSGEWVTLIVFVCTALLWITRPLLTQFTIGADADGEGGWQPLGGLSDAGIAILAAMALFIVPANQKRTGHDDDDETSSGWTFTMNWATAVKLPWGILILFGGGLSLAAAVQSNEVAEFLGALATGLQGYPVIILVLAVTAGVIFLTELTSNTATTATLVPILAALAIGMGIGPEMLIIPATIAASCAFMMPVATPPNAIVFGSGYITIPQMAKAGFWLNMIGVVLVTVMLYAIVLPLLGNLVQ
jgi:sodium-dependent dicarboxylate transporter 2/3/5